MSYANINRIDSALEKIGLPMNPRILPTPWERLEKALQITRQEIHHIESVLDVSNTAVANRLNNIQMRLAKLKDLQLNRFVVIRDGEDYGIYDHGLMIQTSHKILDEAAAYEAARSLNFLHTL